MRSTLSIKLLTFYLTLMSSITVLVFTHSAVFMSPAHDWIDYVNACSTAIIAVFTILLFVGIVSQIRASKTIERAWVMAQIDGDRKMWADGKVHIVEGSGTGGDSTGTWIILSCHNEGKSPAWIYEKRVKFEVVSKVDPAPDFNILPTVFKGREPIGIGQSAIPNVTKLHRLELAKGHAKSGDVMVIYGIVKYHDIFKETHVATFGYKISRETEGYTLERLQEAAYSENT